MNAYKKAAATLSALIAASVGLALTGLAQTAAAAGSYHVTQNGVNVRPGPSTTSGISTKYNQGQGVYISCQVHGQLVTWNGYHSDVWDHTSDGYFSDLYADTPTYGAFSPGMSDCNAAPPVQPAPTAPAGHGRPMGQTVSYNAGYSGYCTWGALDEWHKRAGYYPRLSGDAKYWASSARSYGWQVVADAQPESIVVLQPGVYGASSAGHVGYVTGTDRRSDGLYVTYIEMNYDGTATHATGHVRTVTRKDIAGMSYILRPY